MSKCVCESFFYRSQLLTELLEDKQIAKLGGSWYVQNVSTFPNTFATVSPLTCVFWIQLTRTNVVFSRIALVSRFCAEIQLSVKIGEKLVKILFHQKTHGARRRDGGEAWGLHTHRAYTPWPENIGETAFFPERLPLCCRHQKPRFGTRNSILAPCWDEDLEEIFITIITDVPPSTIHDSPIHVWVIPPL
jgi:hypothetical protein